MNQFYDNKVKELKVEIKRNGSVRKKLSVILDEWFTHDEKNRTKKNRKLLKLFDQLLFENDIIAYTKKENVKEEKKNWDWFDLKSNESFITFVLDTKKNIQNINYYNVIKMRTVNEPTPSVGILDKYIKRF